MTTATNYDQWLYSNQGNEPNFCPHCNADLNDCRCDEDECGVQRALDELDNQEAASNEYMRKINQSKNGMR